MGIVQNVIGMVRDINERKKMAQVDDALRNNYLADPQSSVEKVFQIAPQLGIKMDADLKAQAQQAAETKRKTNSEGMGIVAQYLRGRGPNADYGAAFDSIAPFMTEALGYSPDDVTRMRDAVVANPELINSLDDDVSKARANSQYGANVITPGSALYIGGNRVGESPYAYKTVTTRGGDGSSRTDVFNPNSGEFADGPQGAAAPLTLEEAVTGATGGLPAPRLMPQRATGDMVERFALSSIPGLTADNVTSRERSPEHNAKVGGSKNSYHLASRGAVARDFVPPAGMSMGELHSQLRGAFGRGWDVINEGDHVHIEPAPGGGRLSAGAPTQQTRSGKTTITMPGRAPTAGKQSKTFRTMSPDEVAAQGYPAGTVAQVGSDGSVKVTYKPAQPTAAQKEKTDAKHTDMVNKQNDMIDKMTFMGSQARKLLTHPGLNSSVGTIQGHLPGFMTGTDGQNFRNELQNLKSNIGLNELMKAKALSSQGASGFGNLSNEEGRRLEAAYGTLETTSDEATLKSTLRTIVALTDKSIRLGRQRLKGGTTAAPAPPQVGAVVKGYKFLGGDPASPKSWRKVR